jgi:hypothetical protein
MKSFRTSSPSPASNAQASPGTQAKQARPFHRRNLLRWSVLRSRLHLSRTEWLFLGLLFLCCAYFQLTPSTNTLSRYDMVEALGHGTAIIDPYLLTPDATCAAPGSSASPAICMPTAFSSDAQQACGNAHYACNTIDVSYYEHHYYSPRSLGLSLFAVPLYLLLLGLAMLLHFALDPTVTIALLSLVTIVPWTLLAALLMVRMVRWLRPDLAQSAFPLLITSAYALGTLAYPFSVAFLSHQVGGALMLVALYLLWRARQAETQVRRAFLLLGGLSAGIAVISEYPTGSIALLLAAYIVWVFPGQRLRSLSLFLLGTLPAGATLLVYNLLAFGNPFALSYGFVAGQEFAGQHQGFFGVTLPRLDALATLLVSQRGLLVESPFLLLVPLGLYWWWKQAPQWRAEAVLCGAISLVYLLWNASYFLPMGGFSVPGPRFLVPMLPFACLPLAFCADRLRWLFIPLFAFSVIISFLYVAGGVRIIPDYGVYPFTNLWLPLLATGRVDPHNGPTPLNLGHDLLGLPQPLGLYPVLLPLLGWLAWLSYQTLVCMPRPTSRFSSKVPLQAHKVGASVLKTDERFDGFTA